MPATFEAQAELVWRHLGCILTIGVRSNADVAAMTITDHS